MKKLIQLVAILGLIGGTIAADHTEESGLPGPDTESPGLPPTDPLDFLTPSSTDPTLCTDRELDHHRLSQNYRSADTIFQELSREYCDNPESQMYQIIFYYLTETNSESDTHIILRPETIFHRIPVYQPDQLETNPLPPFSLVFIHNTDGYPGVQFTQQTQERYTLNVWEVSPQIRSPTGRLIQFMVTTHGLEYGEHEFSATQLNPELMNMLPQTPFEEFYIPRTSEHGSVTAVKCCKAYPLPGGGLFFTSQSWVVTAARVSLHQYMIGIGLIPSEDVDDSLFMPPKAHPYRLLLEASESGSEDPIADQEYLAGSILQFTPVPEKERVRIPNTSYCITADPYTTGDPFYKIIITEAQ
ncbi:MAG: hypothetical protein LBJ77_00050 [Holosporales bacterium]|jgi:hypothetical protein|nr:hypothetical protein [Holosporales bacterium]